MRSSVQYCPRYSGDNKKPSSLSRDEGVWRAPRYHPDWLVPRETALLVRYGTHHTSDIQLLGNGGALRRRLLRPLACSERNSRIHSTPAAAPASHHLPAR